MRRLTEDKLAVAEHEFSTILKAYIIRPWIREFPLHLVQKIVLYHWKPCDFKAN